MLQPQKEHLALERRVPKAGAGIIKFQYSFRSRLGSTLLTQGYAGKSSFQISINDCADRIRRTRLVCDRTYGKVLKVRYEPLVFFLEQLKAMAGVAGPQVVMVYRS